MNSSECEKCKWSIIDETNKAKIIVTCRLRSKAFYFGQNIQCSEMEKKEENENGADGNL